MEQSEDDQVGGEWGSAAWSIICTALGAVLLVLAVVAWRSTHLDMVDAVLKYDSRGQGSKMITSKGLSLVLIVLATSVIICSLFTLIAAVLRKTSCICSGFICNGILGAFIILIGPLLIMRQWQVVPILKSQTKLLCGATEFTRLSNELQCGYAGKFVSTVGTCDPICAETVTDLQSADGCNWLVGLCSDDSYDASGGNGCPSSTPAGPLVKKLGQTCERECTDDVTCNVYIHKGGECFLQTMQPSTYAAAWSAVSTADVADIVAGLAGKQDCYVKQVNGLLNWFRAIGWGLCAAAVIGGVIILVVVWNQWRELYNLNFRRVGKPNALQCCCTLVCPCCDIGFSYYEESDDDMDGDSDTVLSSSRSRSSREPTFRS